MEREEKLKALRKKEQAARLDRVSTMPDSDPLNLTFCRKEKRLGLHRRGRRRSGRRIMHMMSFSRKLTPTKQTIRIEGKTGKMISCRLSRIRPPWRELDAK